MTDEEEYPNQESPLYHTVYYTCPKCTIVEMETKYLVLAHNTTWEYRESQEPCVLCKRDEEETDAV